MSAGRKLAIDKGYDEKTASDFREVLHRSGVPCMEFTLAPLWGDAARQGKGADVCRYRLLDGGEVVGLFQGIVERAFTVSSMVSGATSGDGVAIRPGYADNDLRDFLSQILRSDRFSVSQLYVPHAVELKGFSSTDRYTFQIALSEPVDSILSHMEQRTRYTVRKAEKTSLSVEIQKSDEALSMAYGMIVETADSKEFALPRWRYTQEIHKRFNQNGDSLCALAFHEGRLVSAAHFLGYDRKLNWLAGGSNTEGYRLNAMSLVQMRTIEWARNAGYLVYDMGGTNFTDPALEGIHRFKRGFGGKLVKGSLLVRTPWYFPLLAKAKNLVDAARKRSYRN